MYRRARSEDVIQRDIIQHLQIRAMPGVVWYAIPNGGARSKIEAAIMKSTGTVAGMPDLGFVRDGKPYFLELKADGGRATEQQLECISRLDAAGAFTSIA